VLAEIISEDELGKSVSQRKSSRGTHHRHVVEDLEELLPDDASLPVSRLLGAEE
jgi:hypothetical protein